MRSWKTKSGYKIIRIMSGRSNVFLLTNEQKNILIDTSVSGLWNTLIKQLEKLNINKIDYLILTHAHYDHVGNACSIKEKYKPLIIIQEKEAGYLAKGENVPVYGTTFITKPIAKFLGKRLLFKLKYRSCRSDLTVDAHFDLKDFGFNAYLINTPGHTIGSMSLIIDDEIAIVGDAMFGVFKWSVFPPYAEDEVLLVKSWGKLLETKCSEFLPSHGTANSRSLVLNDFNKRIKQSG